MPRRQAAQTDGAAPPQAPGAGDPRAQYRFRERFGALIAATGIAGVPRALCHYLGELGLSYADLGFITHLLSYRWTTAYPFPKQRKLATQAGLTRNGIQRRVYALQSLGYLNAHERFDQQSGRRTTNSYDLTPLLDRLNDLILRDWDTVWKHRDPLVADSAEDDAVDDDVDNTPSGRRMSASPRTQSSAIPHTQTSTGSGREIAAIPADASGQHGLDAPELAPDTDEDAVSGLDEAEEEPAHRPAATASPLDVSLPDELVRAIGDYSDEFGDRRHLAGNRTRTMRLWQQSGLSEAEFIRAIYTAGARTAARADKVRGSQPDEQADGPKNLMPYFFGVLKGVVTEVTAGAGGDGAPAASSAVRKIALRLAKSLHPTLVDGWLAGARVISHDRTSGELVLATTSDVGARKLGAEYQRLLVRAANDAIGDVSAVELRLE